MKVYKIETDSNHIRALCSIGDLGKKVRAFKFDCTPIETLWEKPDVYIHNPHIKAKNFYDYLSTSTLVFDQEVYSIYDSLFEMAGEVLPIQVERGEKLYLLNVLECRNVVDYQHSIWDTYSDGTKGRMLKQVFIKERIFSNSSLFKIPETIKTEVFCYDDGSDETFYYLYHKHQFTGLYFEEIEIV